VWGNAQPHRRTARIFPRAAPLLAPRQFAPRRRSSSDAASPRLILMPRLRRRCCRDAADALAAFAATLTSRQMHISPLFFTTLRLFSPLLFCYKDAHDAVIVSLFQEFFLPRCRYTCHRKRFLRLPVALMPVLRRRAAISRFFAAAPPLRRDALAQPFER
jgi:hypothetical protein